MEAEVDLEVGQTVFEVLAWRRADGLLPSLSWAEMIAYMQATGETVRSTRVGHSDQLLLRSALRSPKQPLRTDTDIRSSSRDSRRSGIRLIWPTSVEKQPHSLQEDPSMVIISSSRISKAMPDRQVFV